MHFIRSYIIAVVVITPLVFAGTKSDARLSAALQHLSPHDEILAWVFFIDKGSHELLKSSVPHAVVSQRSFQRRLKVRPDELAVDYTDLPVEPDYVRQIAVRVERVRQVSKWFNGVSVEATQAQLLLLESLPFVSKLELVTRMKRNSEFNEASVELDETSLKVSMRTNPEPQTISETSTLDYGLSFDQLNQINIPAVHATGNYGQGVIIGSFDNGFRLLTHEAFDTLRPRIVATYDFVDKKVSVVPNNPSTGFGAHGIVTLSAMAGYKSGQLIGPAFGASFILARTENDSSETPFEEDNWVAAIEWADSIGVDITSTSLGYLTYDAPYPSWTWEQMNGNTTIITRAADMAVSKGIVVVNSAGNNGLNAAHNTLNAPADGDSVLTIGAVTSSGTRASFSSVGPTTSTPARIKPDVMALGVAVRCASATEPTQFTTSQGTSLSCPLAAGVAALLIHAKPSASPREIMNAMRNTASRATSPDREMGYGILNAASAISLLTGVPQPPSPTAFALLQNYPNPFNPKTIVTYNLPQPSRVSFRIYNLLGQEIRTLVNESQASGLKTREWDARSNNGNLVPTGMYFGRLEASGSDGTSQFNQTIKLVFLK